MNIVEMYELCKRIYNENTGKYDYIGLRFEDKEREIGETCECSRNNVDREDEREFPEYGTEEYFEMEELDGTSAWDMEQEGIYDIPSYWDIEKECSRHFLTWHCYIIAGNRLGHTSNTVIDENEIVIKDAVVIAKIF